MAAWLTGGAKAKPRIFVSYSMKHSAIVEGHVAVLKPIADVYYAEHKLEAGQSIKTSLADEIARAKSFYLFWCHHAAASNWVAWELHEALRHAGMRIVVIRLDHTALPEPIAGLKYVDSFAGACLPDDLAETMGWDAQKHGMDKHGWDGGFPDRKIFEHYCRLKDNAEQRFVEAVTWIGADLESLP